MRRFTRRPKLSFRSLAGRTEPWPARCASVIAMLHRLRVEKAEYTVWDTHTSGLGLRVRPSGYRSFVFFDQRDGVSKRHTLGQVSLMDVSQARAMCRDTQAGKETGRAQTRKTLHVSLFRDFVATTWKAACHDRFKPSSRRNVNYMPCQGTSSCLRSGTCRSTVSRGAP